MDYKSLEERLLYEGQTCPKCNGKKTIKVLTHDPKESDTKPCPFCQGRGKVLYIDYPLCP